MSMYGGRLGAILDKYNNLECPECSTKQVQIISYLSGDPEWKCRHCKHKWSLPFEGSDETDKFL